MQQVRLWEVTPDGSLQSMPSAEINLEQDLENWLTKNISILDPNLLVIGRQVETGFGGKIDLLCLNSDGDIIVLELKKGKTPREVAAQALEYASWVSSLSTQEITSKANSYLTDSGGLNSAFYQKFGLTLPDDLNQTHSSLIVAESIDPSTERIVRYLSTMDVPINAAAIQHFNDKTGRSILVPMYLIDPEENVTPPSPIRRQTLKSLQEMADKNGIGALYNQIKNGIRGVLTAKAYRNRVWYQLQRIEGGLRTVLIVYAEPQGESDGVRFTVHATRLKEHLGIDLETLRTWVPNTSDADVSGWAGSSADERKSAVGLAGYLQSEKEVDKFVSALRNAISQSRTS